MEDVFYTLPKIWDFCLERIYDRQEYVNGFIGLLKRIGVTQESLILDAGCGSGFLTIDLIKKGYRIVGTDKSDEMIRQTKINADEAGVSIEAYNVMWGELSKRFDQMFDLVYCRGNSLVYAASWERNWIVPARSEEEIEKAIKNFYDVLKPGGYLYVDTISRKEKPHEESIGVVDTDYGPVDITWAIEHDKKNSIRTWTVKLRFLETGLTKTYPSYSYFLPHTKLIDTIKGAGFKEIEEYVGVKGERNYDSFLARK